MFGFYNAEGLHLVDGGSTAVNGAGKFIEEDLSLDQPLEISLEGFHFFIRRRGGKSIWEGNSSPGELFAFSNFLQQHLSMNGIEGAAFATFGHDPCSFLWGETPEFHMFNHLPDEVERDHAMATQGVEF